MADPMKVRATLHGDAADVRVLMNHPMETGQRKDPSGKLIPLHFIQEVTVKLNGKTVIEGQISQAVSRNPVFSFRVKGAKAGDRLEIAWLDNKGDRNSTETALA
jgi:sulfur-oxidizing protein SoxZ